MDMIAEHRLVALIPDIGPVPVYLRIGRPVAHPKGDWVCPVQAEGLLLWQGPSEIFGIDSWHALMLGLRFVRSMLAAEADRGVVFQTEGGMDAISIMELFVLGEIE